MHNQKDQVKEDEIDTKSRMNGRRGIPYRLPVRKPEGKRLIGRPRYIEY
jgi:hypothetical protein